MKIYSSEISGSLKVKGDIKAENYIVQSTVSQITRSFASGSSIFGDSQNDTHQFTGSILLTGSMAINKGSNAGNLDIVWREIPCFRFLLLIFLKLVKIFIKSLLLIKIAVE